MSTKTIIGISLIILGLIVIMVVFLVIWETITEPDHIEPTELIPIIIDDNLIILPTLPLIQDKIEIQDNIEQIEIDIQTTDSEIDRILEAIRRAKDNEK